MIKVHVKEGWIEKVWESFNLPSFKCFIGRFSAPYKNCLHTLIVWTVFRWKTPSHACCCYLRSSFFFHSMTRFFFCASSHNESDKKSTTVQQDEDAGREWGILLLLCVNITADVCVHITPSVSCNSTAESPTVAIQMLDSILYCRIPSYFNRISNKSAKPHCFTFSCVHIERLETR